MVHNYGVEGRCAQGREGLFPRDGDSGHGCAADNRQSQVGERNFAADTEHVDGCEGLHVRSASLP